MTGNAFIWSKTPASNDSADSSINWAEGQSPSSVNNSARGMMAGIANLTDDQGGQLSLAGGTTAYTLTTNSVITALRNGLMISAKVNATNTGASTLAVDGLTAKSIRRAGDAPIVAGDLVIGAHVLLQYDDALNSAAGGWLILARSSSNVSSVAPFHVYNSGFEVWQRTTSLAIAASTTAVASIYGPDRWSMETAANQACVIARQTGLTTTSQYCVRVQRNSGQTGTGILRFQQWFETVDAIQLRGRTVALSCTLRAGSNYSAASGNLIVRLYTGTGAEGRRTLAGGAWTGEATPIDATQAITTTATRYTFTSTTLGAAITQAAIAFEFTPVGTASTNDYFEVDDIQLDEGIIASSYVVTPFQVDLEQCQRYWEKSYSYATAVGTNTSAGSVINNTNGGTINTVFLQAFYRTSKRAVGTPVTYNPVTGAAGSMRDGAGTAAGTTNTAVGEISFGAFNSGAGLAADSSASMHWVIEAEL